MIMCVLLCYPVSIHMSHLLSTGRPISSLNYKERPSLNLCTCYPLTPGDLIHSAMRSNTEIVHSFCGG